MIKLVNQNNQKVQLFDTKLSAINFAIRRYRFYEEIWKLE